MQNSNLLSNILILIVIFILLNQYEAFDTNNEYGFKNRFDVLSSMIDVSIKCLLSPLKCFIFPTNTYPIGHKKGRKCNNNNPFLIRDKSNDKVNQAGLCYTKCKPNYKGVAHLCWERCNSNEYKSGLQCITKCKDNYDTLGSICWKKNKKIKGPLSYIPNKRFIKNYNRGVGKLPNICSDPDTYKLLPLLCKEYWIVSKIWKRSQLLV